MPSAHKRRHHARQEARAKAQAARAVQDAAPASTGDRMVISPEAAALLGQFAARGRRRKDPPNPFVPASFPPPIGHNSGAKAAAPVPLAMDEATTAAFNWGNAGFSGSLAGYAADEGLTFLGYPTLAALAQRPEYRRVVEVLAQEMTRKWIRLVNREGGEETQKRLDALWQEMEERNIRDLFRKALEGDGFMGRAHLYLAIEGDERDGERATAIGNGVEPGSAAKVGKGRLKRIQFVEAYWAQPDPQGFNARSPLDEGFYTPGAWNVMGQRVHADRLLTFVGREVPDIMKPAYGFGGLSMIQICKPYVDNWVKTRESVSDLISSFSVSGIKGMKLAKALAGGAMQASQGQGGLMDLFARIQIFNDLRDNRGLMALDEGEEFFNISTPLGTLDKLQAQAQEHIASISGIPLVKLLGITPSGLNASSDGEVRVFYDSIHAGQEKLVAPNLKRTIAFLQLHLFGEVDPAIGFEFEPLWQMSEKEKAEVATARTTAIMSAEPILNPATVLRELREMADATNVFTQITDEDIAEAEAMPPPGEALGGPEGGEEVEPGAEPPANENDVTASRESFLAALRSIGADAAPRPLYVSRRVLNADEVVAWAVGQGLQGVKDPASLHVTIMWTAAAVDWMVAGQGWVGEELMIPAGGPRMVEAFGPRADHVVLSFACQELQYRNAEMQTHGAIPTRDSYQPHVTVARGPQTVDLAQVVPFPGRIYLGPEVFEEAQA